MARVLLERIPIFKLSSHTINIHKYRAQHKHVHVAYYENLLFWVQNYNAN